MKKYLNRASNYDKYPSIKMSSEHKCWQGWTDISKQLIDKLSNISSSKKTIVIECYQGIYEEEVEINIRKIFSKAIFIKSTEAMLSQSVLNEKMRADITNDELFGYLTRYTMEDYFDLEKVETVRKRISDMEDGIVVVYGVGAAYIQPQYNILVYADMARWEIQMRHRRNQVSNIGANNKEERTSLKHKRAYFIDWRICDRFKKALMDKWDYVLDTNTIGSPKMSTGKAVRAGLEAASRKPFRVVPFFDAGPWGGQWMKEVCDLDKSSINYAWCFDCVPEENSLYLDFDGVNFEIPSIDLVFAYPKELLGDPVYGRFGAEFPIRFDFLDTMQGGNLSLQVHPTVEFLQENFGMHYTQDESYYIVEAEEDAVVYLGLKNGIDKDEMINDLRRAQAGEIVFDAEKYAGIYPIKKHDHALIPAGTVHCSGANSVVLEISATPNLFTFKLWDWGRLGLDGRPRPINVERGKEVIQWERDEDWVRREILDRRMVVAQGDGWREEFTGLHEREFIETRRHYFTKPVLHNTNDGVTVFNLVEGDEAIIESPTNAFEPFIVHYAETFIIPASVKEYTIRPYGLSEGKECVTIKAYVRANAYE